MKIAVFSHLALLTLSILPVLAEAFYKGRYSRAQGVTEDCACETADSGVYVYCGYLCYPFTVVTGDRIW